MRPPQYNGGSDAWREALEEAIEQRLRTLGTRAPGCSRAGCAERNPFALTGVSPAIVCYEHQALQKGRRWLEDHHWLGQHNSTFAIPIPGNDHRVLSGCQALWPRETLRNPEASPLLVMAAGLRGWLDLLWLLIDRVVGRIPAGLEWLDRRLCEVIGPRWWENIGWEPT